MMGNKKLQVWLPLIFSIVLITGMFLGYRLKGNNTGKNDFFAGNRRSSLQEALDLIKLKYVDSVHIDSLEGKAIEEMMSELDPHSVYLPPVELKEANEDLEGNFEGIGVEFNIFSDTVNVVYVIPNGPSDKAGLKIGDKIIRVNDSPMTRRPLTIDGIKKNIRGSRGSKVKIDVLRARNEMHTITVTRGTIPVPSVDAGYMIAATTGYIKLNKFTTNSYEEFMQSLEAMKKQGLQKLILDLRGNGGGFMNEAVDMADEFLDGNKLVVYTEGVNSKKKEYHCKRPGIFEKGTLILLVDELSASASEVLAGALQDWCRATVIGRRTFGKGLVQDQFSLVDGGAIRLTIARYYTPLGRSIQRSYAKGKKIYLDELWERFNSGEMFSADSIRNHNNGKKFITNCKDTICNCKDTLYGGDGITPKIFVPADTSLYARKINHWLTGNELNNYTYNYYLKHRGEIDKYKTPADYVARFDDSGIWNAFVTSPAVAVDFKKATPRERALLGLRLKALLARYKWRNSGYFQVLNSEDPVIRKAVAFAEAHQK